MKVCLHLNTSAGAAPDRKLPAAWLVSAALSLAAAPCVLAVMTDLWLLQLPARTQTSTERRQLQLCSDSTGLRSQAVGRVESDWRRRDRLRWEATCRQKLQWGSESSSFVRRTQMMGEENVTLNRSFHFRAKTLLETFSSRCEAPLCSPNSRVLQRPDWTPTETSEGMLSGVACTQLPAQTPEPSS